MKLIRDLLPERFKTEGSPAVIDRVTDPEEMKRLLIEKLIEEVLEFSANPSIEEMADIQEVIAAIQMRFGMEFDVVRQAQEVKRRDKGSFNAGYVMKIEKFNHR